MFSPDFDPTMWICARIALGDPDLSGEGSMVTVLATVEPTQAFLQSGDGINRGKEPIDRYVPALAPAPVPAEPASPSMSGSTLLA